MIALSLYLETPMENFEDSEKNEDSQPTFLIKIVMKTEI